MILKKYSVSLRCSWSEHWKPILISLGWASIVFGGGIFIDQQYARHRAEKDLKRAEQFLQDRVTGIQKILEFTSWRLGYITKVSPGNIRFLLDDTPLVDISVLADITGATWSLGSLPQSPTWTPSNPLTLHHPVPGKGYISFELSLGSMMQNFQSVSIVRLGPPQKGGQKPHQGFVSLSSPDFGLILDTQPSGNFLIPLVSLVLALLMGFISYTVGIRRFWNHKLHAVEIEKSQISKNLQDKTQELTRLEKTKILINQAQKCQESLFREIMERTRQVGQELVDQMLQVSHSLELSEKSAGVLPAVFLKKDDLFGEAQKQRFDFQEIFSRVLTLLKPLLHDIRFKLQGKLDITLQGDSLMMEVILLNTLGKRLNYLPRQGELTIQLRRTKDKLTLEIIDNGYDLGETDPFFKISNNSFFSLNPREIEKMCVKNHVTMTSRLRQDGLHCLRLRIPLQKPETLLPLRKDNVLPFRHV